LKKNDTFFIKKTLIALALIFLSVMVVLVSRDFLGPRMQFSVDERSLLRSKGDRNAPIWIVEYLDYQCSSCAAAHRLVQEYFDRYPGKIHYQIRFFPLVSHLYALKAAIYSECAARQGRFWEFHDLLLGRQEKWSGLPKEKIDAVFESYAQEAKISVDRLKTCVGNPEVKQSIFEEADAARSLGVKLTPTCFINGKIVVGYRPLEEELEKLLAGKEKKAA
jgi:protein-disulfide isomerase